MNWTIIKFILWLLDEAKEYWGRRAEEIEKLKAANRARIVSYFYEFKHDRDDVLARMVVDMPITTVARVPMQGYLRLEHHQLFYLLHRLRVRPRRVAQ